jgi:hypothetical protein
LPDRRDQSPGRRREDAIRSGNANPPWPRKCGSTSLSGKRMLTIWVGKE